MVNRGAQGRGSLTGMLARSAGRGRSGGSSVLSWAGGEEKGARRRAKAHGLLWGRGRHCFPARVSGHLEHRGLSKVVVSKAGCAYTRGAQDRPLGRGKKVLFVPLFN